MHYSYHNFMKALILAGGRGKRMKPLTDKIPKPLLPVAGEPFLTYLINFFRNQGIKEFVLATGYKRQMIENYFSDGKKLKIRIIYSKEKSPLDTGGAIKLAENLIKDKDLLILNGDSFVELNLKKMLKFHQKMKQPITMAVIKVKNSSRSGQIMINSKDIITRFEEKGEKKKENLINAGVYIFQKKILKNFPEDKKISLEKQIFPKFVGKIAAFKTKGYFIDIGVKKDYRKFNKDIRKLSPEIRNIFFKESKKRIKRKKKINNKTKQILLGSLLGDGGLHFNGVNAYFREQHSLEQQDYLLWKAKHLKIFGIKSKKGKSYDKRTKRQYSYICIWSRVHPILTKYYRLFYPEDTKIVPSKILEQIEPLGLAVWYMDDGYFRNNSKNLKLSTDGYTLNENTIISKWFKRKWNIETAICKDRKNYYLFFDTYQTNKLLGIIKNFIHKSMIYKLGHFSPKNLEQINDSYQRRREKEKIRYHKLIENPDYRKEIRERQKIAQRRRLENPDYKKRYNEYHKNYERNKRQISERERAIFVDVDGTLIEEVPYINNVSDVKLLPMVGESIAKLNNDFLIIGMTNKSSIEKGYCSEEELFKIFRRIKKEFSKHKARIDKFYYCSHSEETNCLCRKPKTKLIFDALKRFKKIDLNKSWLIGDRTRDIQVGINLKSLGYKKFKTISVATGYGLKDNEFSVKPDFFAKNLLEAIKTIIPKGI